MRWSLDNIYKGFDCPEYTRDVKILKKKIDEFNNLIDSFSVDDILDYFERMFILYEEICSTYIKLNSFVSLRISCNSKDKEAMDNNTYLLDLYVTISLIESRIIRSLKKYKDSINLISKSKILKDYSFLIEEFIEKSKHILSDELEESISSLLNYGAISYGDLQHMLVSKYKVNIYMDGEYKEIPLTKCRSLLEDSSRELRIEALKAEKRLYKFMEDPISFSLNNIKKSVLYDVEKRGYDSPLNKSLRDNRMSEETLNSLIYTIEDSLDLFRDFLRLKGSIIGDKDKKVYFSDLFSSTRESSKKVDFNYAKEFLITNFNTFSPKVSNFVRHVFENDWIDSDIYEGKVGGAFCSNINPIGESRILMNFNNSYDSIFTLAHELGHAYHGDVLKGERILNTDYPMTIAETASIFFETLICDKAFKMEDSNERIIILEYELNSATQTIVDIYSRFLFEREVFDRCKDEFLTSEDLNMIMLNAQRCAYGDAMHDEYFKEAWIYKSHYYDFNYNFYNYPYAFGLLFSLSIYSKYLNGMNNFHEKYEELLRNSGKSSLEDLGKIFNVDIRKREFFKLSIDILRNKYNEYKSLINE